MRCTLKIVTRSEGSEQVAEFTGALTETEEGARVFYIQDGDPSVLLFTKDALTMERKGAVRLEAKFSLAASKMTLSGSSVSEIPLKTLVYAFAKHPLGYRLTLAYDLYLFSEPTGFHLEIFIDREVL